MGLKIKMRRLCIIAFLLIGFGTASKVPNQTVVQKEEGHQPLKEELDSQIHESDSKTANVQGEKNPSINEGDEQDPILEAEDGLKTWEQIVVGVVLTIFIIGMILGCKF